MRAFSAWRLRIRSACCYWTRWQCSSLASFSLDNFMTRCMASVTRVLRSTRDVGILMMTLCLLRISSSSCWTSFSNLSTTTRLLPILDVRRIFSKGELWRRERPACVSNSLLLEGVFNVFFFFGALDLFVVLDWDRLLDFSLFLRLPSPLLPFISSSTCCSAFFGICFFLLVFDILLFGFGFSSSLSP